jgi:hypothetical protein
MGQDQQEAQAKNPETRFALRRELGGGHDKKR